MSYNVAKALGLEDDPEHSVEKSLQENVPEKFREEALKHAQHYMNLYIELGCLKRLLDEGIGSIHGKSTREFPEFTLHGRPDICNLLGEPIETKVNGATSKTGVSPTAGYRYSYYSDGTVKYKHIRCGDSLEQINSDWATQLTIYNWINNGIHPIKPIKGRVEQVAVRGNVIAFASFENYITTAFQQWLYDELKNMWTAIQSGEFIPPTATPNRCVRYNQLCQAAPHCKFFAAAQDTDPTARMLKGM